MGHSSTKSYAFGMDSMFGMVRRSSNVLFSLRKSALNSSRRRYVCSMVVMVDALDKQLD